MGIQGWNFTSESKQTSVFYAVEYVHALIPAAAWSKAWVCGRSLAGDCGFEYGRRHVFVVCCQVEVSATGRSLVQRSTSEYVLLSVIMCNNNLQRVGRKTS